MSLPPVVAANQMLLFAALSIGQRAAKQLGVRPDASIAELTREADRNRTYVYEVADRVLAALAMVASTPPGRPEKATSDTPAATIPGLLLENRVLRFRIEHPDACVVGPCSRHEYSARFRRFILEIRDAWGGSLEEFAAHVGLPPDTIRDWLDADRRGLTPPIPEPKPPVEVPCDATDLVRRVATLFAAWEGSTREFIRDAARRFCLVPAQVVRLLRILGCIRPYRRSTSRFRHRGSTRQLSPGSVLVSDGTTIGVAIIGESEIVDVNWQGTVDQATGCHTAIVVTDEESADSLIDAHQDSCDFLGRHPLALIHDNKPCYASCHDSGSFYSTCFHPTELIAATLERPENKAVVEGAFGLFSQQVGLLLIDATDSQSLARSVVAEVVRAWAAGRDHSPHPDFDGRSRREVLREHCPSAEQIERDLAFLRRLKSRHEQARRPRLYEDSRRLLDHLFSEWGLLDKDPRARLRSFLSRFCPDAIRRAAAVVFAKLHRHAIDLDHLDRYLTKVVQNMQDQIDLEVAERELLRLCQLQRTTWTKDAQADLDSLRAQGLAPLELAKALAESAAFGALPIEGLFWTQALLENLCGQPHLLPDVRRFLVRLYEAPFQRRLALLDMLAALEVGIQ
jgi:hypothetical protein